MGTLSKEDLKEIAEVLGPIIATSVQVSLDNHKTQFGVDNEIHYQDHMFMAQCRKNYTDKIETHRLIADLNEDGKLESAVRFSNKLEKREGRIVKTFTRVSVAAIAVGSVTYAKETFQYIMALIRNAPSP